MMRNTGIGSGIKHTLCQRHFIKHPEVLLEPLFLEDRELYYVQLEIEYKIETDVPNGQSLRVDMLAEIRRGPNYVETVPVEIKGNTDDRRRKEALRYLLKCKRRIDWTYGNPYLKSARIERGLVVQGYELRDGSNIPEFRFTVVPFNPACPIIYA